MELPLPVDHFEKQIFDSNSDLIAHIVYRHRYVDDVLCLWTSTRPQSDEFLSLLNSQYDDNEVIFSRIVPIYTHYLILSPFVFVSIYIQASVILLTTPHSKMSRKSLKDLISCG